MLHRRAGGGIVVSPSLVSCAPMSPIPEDAGRGSASADGSHRLVASLAALNVLSYVDRQMIAALAPLLIVDLGLSRAEIGLLVGVAFMAVFAPATLAAGVAADRCRRPRVLAGGLAAWSAATGLSSAAVGFVPLLVCRSLVGVGEATLSPTALSMLADRVRPERLGVANGIFYAGIPVGFACSFALAGWIGPRFGWRACFLVLGILGVLAVASVWRMTDPPRHGPDPQAPTRGRALVRVARLLAERPAIAVLMLAGALLAYTSASSQHAITWLVEERGFSYQRAAWISAIVIATAGLAGNLGIGALTDRARRRHSAGRLLSFVAIGVVAFVVTAAFYTLPSSSPLFMPCWILAQAWLLGWYGPLLAAVLEQSPADLRATVAAVALLAINLLGVATGPWVTGMIGDRASLTQGLVGSLGVGAIGLVLVTIVGLRLLHRREIRLPPPMA